MVGARAEARLERQHAAQGRVAAVHVDTLRRRVQRGLRVTQQERLRGTTRKVGVVVSAAAAATRIEDREGTEKETNSSDHQSQRNTIVLLLC